MTINPYGPPNDSDVVDKDRPAVRGRGPRNWRSISWATFLFSTMNLVVVPLLLVFGAGALGGGHGVQGYWYFALVYLAFALLVACLSLVTAYLSLTVFENRPWWIYVVSIYIALPLVGYFVVDLF